MTTPTRPPAPSAPRPEVGGAKGGGGGVLAGKCGRSFLKFNSEIEDEIGDGKNNSTGFLRIVNGRRARQGEFPWLVITNY